jgi:DNA recombination protein RmuC
MDGTTVVVALAAVLVASLGGGVLAAVVVARGLRAPTADARSGALDHQVTVLAGELARLEGTVQDLRREGAAQHGAVAAGLADAVRATAALQGTTGRLAEVLANSRARGQWGERMADDVLRAAGLVEGLTYRRQMVLAGGGRPDVTFLLPEDRLLHMDVKFPLDNYVRVLDAPDDAQRAAAIRRFTRDARDRVGELGGRGYTDPDTTVGFVLLFVPNESVYGFLLEHDPALADRALAQGVVLCSPFTLFAVLAVVRHAVDTFHLARTGDEILECLAGVTKQWEAFADRFDRLGAQLATATRSYDELAGTRRRQLEKQLGRIEALRARHDDDTVATPPEPDSEVGPGSVVLPPCPAST